MNEIPMYVPPRKDQMIDNKISIVPHEYNDDFHIVIYYLEDHKCKIITRRLDADGGWGQILKIKVDEEEITIGPSEENCKIIEVEVKIKLIKSNLDYYQKIPKRIVQTANNNKFKSIYHYNSVMTFLELNPEYEYVFFDDKARRLFIKKYFEEDVLEAYDMLVPGAYKADLFRYCYLHIYGGCYFDCKMILREPLKNFINKYMELIVCKGRLEKAYANGVIFSTQGKMKDVIENCVFNILNKRFCDNSLKITGPFLFYSSLENRNKSVELKNQLMDKPYEYQKGCIEFILTKKIIITNNYKGYYDGYIGVSHYHGLYQKREVFYNNLYLVDQYKIYLYPNSSDDKFVFNIIDNKLVIQKINDEKGWTSHHKIKVIDNDKNQEYIINLLPSTDNIYILEDFTNENNPIG